MRDGPSILVLLGSLLAFGCRSDAGTVSEQSAPARAEAEPARTEPEPEPTPERSSDHAERVADLDALCRALDRDYVDGTLSDYYAKVEPRTDWGRERLREGEESITPGRLLQKAATELAVDLDARELAGCRKLFDELDELE